MIRILIFLVGFSHVAFANTTYFSPDRQSVEQLEEMLSDLRPGDSLLLFGGLIPLPHSLEISVKGEAENGIYIGGVSGHQVVFNGDSFTKQSGEKQRLTGLIHIENSHFLTLENITVTKSHFSGIYLYGENTTNITVRDCRVDETYRPGIEIYLTDSVRILNCEITRANDLEMGTTEKQRNRREAPHEALSIRGGRNFEIAYNHVHLNYKEGIDCKETSQNGIIHHNRVHDNLRQGIYLDSWFGQLSDIDVFANESYDNEWGIVISAEGEGSHLSNVKIYNNLIFNNRGSGILFGTWGFDEPREEIYIYHNTIYHNGTPGHWAGPTGGIDIRSAKSKNVFIYYNIISGNSAFEIGAFNVESAELKTRKIEIDQNLVTRKSAESASEAFLGPIYGILPENQIWGEPYFVAPDLHDFRLRSASPARNRTGGDYTFTSGQNLGVDPLFLSPIGITNQFN